MKINEWMNECAFLWEKEFTENWPLSIAFADRMFLCSGQFTSWKLTIKPHKQASAFLHILMEWLPQFTRASMSYYCGQQSSSKCHLQRNKQKIGKHFTTEELPYVLSCISLHIQTLKQTLTVKIKDIHCISICNFMYRKNSISML